MNDNDELAVERFARAWQVETVDVTEMVAERIDSSSPEELLMAQVLRELRAVRSEMADLRNENRSLRTEIGRLRSEIGAHQPHRISPFSPSENFARSTRN